MYVRENVKLLCTDQTTAVITCLEIVISLLERKHNIFDCSRQGSLKVFSNHLVIIMSLLIKLAYFLLSLISTYTAHLMSNIFKRGRKRAKSK